VAITENLVANFPNVPAHVIELGGAYCNFGNLIRGGGQPEAALDWYQKAIETLSSLVAKKPRLADARKFLRNSHQGKAEALDELDRGAEAARDWEVAMQLDSGSRRGSFRLRMFRSKKDAAGCLAAAAETETRTPSDAGALYDAACNRAVCAAVIQADPKTPAEDSPRLASEQADLAMGWLRQAVAAGYRDVQHMARDKDLDALREREDFKNIMAELEASTKGIDVETQGSEQH
jgi:hypothetical protein